MPQLTFIVGAGRSGTSAITRAFEACGADLGVVYEPHAEHVKGKAWIKRMLRIRRLDPLGQHPLPAEPLNVTGSEIETLAAGLGAANVVKDVKLLFVWPSLLERFPDARFVYVWRDPVSIADSCLRTSFMRAYRTRADWFRWARAYQRFAEDLERAAPDRVLRVKLSDLLEGDERLIRSAVVASGLQWRPRQVAKTLRPKQWHGG